jgi:mannose-6-phosphate isomerase-like protein (cupin superfamily)
LYFSPAWFLSPTQRVDYHRAMAIEVRRIDDRRYDPAKMQKLGLFDTPRFFCDIYCLEPAQEQRPHAHAGADKVYVVLEGRVTARIGAAETPLLAGDAVLAPAGEDHGITNPGPDRAALLVFMAPRPG